MADTSLRDVVAALFLSAPGLWINASQIAKVGGQFASRTRISECRTQLRMDIQNRTRRVTGLDGRRYTVSEYRYTPAVVGQARLPLHLAVDEQAEV